MPPPPLEGGDIIVEKATPKPKAKGTKKAKKAKGRPDEDLFGDTTDIFGDISATKAEKPKKKKKKKIDTSATATGEAGEGESEWF